eukprot:GILI01018562.1.p1 GENE.GILI01018562.1~~GILI01018562.1.p1  ORF type:complete len:342 (-),score=40.61 GILI01018562.1:40-1065(-)
MTYICNIALIAAVLTAHCLHAYSKADTTLCTEGQFQSPISFLNLNAKRGTTLRPIQFSSSCRIGVNQEMHLRRSSDGIVGELIGSQPCTIRDPMTGNTMIFDYLDLHSIPEHEFSDIKADMEVQMYFKGSGSTVVLAVPVVCKSPDDDNTKISQFLDMFVQQSRAFLKHFNDTAAVEEFNTHPHGILHLLPTADRSYVTYSGSLTVAPCTEGVQWYVFTSPLHVRLKLDKDAIELQKDERLGEDNHRAVQPVNGRLVSRYVDPTAHPEGYLSHRESAQKSTKLLGSTLAVTLSLAGIALLFIVALYAFHHFSHKKSSTSDQGDIESRGLAQGSPKKSYGSV